MKAAGTTLTVGELRAEIAHLADNDPVTVVDAFGDGLYAVEADATQHDVTVVCDVEGVAALTARVEVLEELLGEIRDSATKGSILSKSMIVKRAADILS
jgi:hypothetical protein